MTTAIARHSRSALLACALLAPALVLAGTSAWRCGPEGRAYTDEPCAGGREIALPEPRPLADVQAAERLAARERAAGERMRREREAREAASIVATRVAVNLGPTRSARLPAQPSRPQLAPPKSKNKPADLDADERTWRATVPASRQSRG